MVQTKRFMAISSKAAPHSTTEALITDVTTHFKKKTLITTTRQNSTPKQSQISHKATAEAFGPTAANVKFWLMSQLRLKGRVERIFFFASFKLPLFSEYKMVFIIA